jgi:hypothetical protein
MAGTLVTALMPQLSIPHMVMLNMTAEHHALFKAITTTPKMLRTTMTPTQIASPILPGLLMNSGPALPTVTPAMTIQQTMKQLVKLLSLPVQETIPVLQPLSAPTPNMIPATLIFQLISMTLKPSGLPTTQKSQVAELRNSRLQLLQLQLVLIHIQSSQVSTCTVWTLFLLHTQSTVITTIYTTSFIALSHHKTPQTLPSISMYLDGPWLVSQISVATAVTLASTLHSLKM